MPSTRTKTTSRTQATIVLDPEELEFPPDEETRIFRDARQSEPRPKRIDVEGPTDLDALKELRRKLEGR
jgi:hypothetical protein